MCTSAASVRPRHPWGTVPQTSPSSTQSSLLRRHEHGRWPWGRAVPTQPAPAARAEANTAVSTYPSQNLIARYFRRAPLLRLIIDYSGCGKNIRKEAPRRRVRRWFASNVHAESVKAICYPSGHCTEITFQIGARPFLGLVSQIISECDQEHGKRAPVVDLRLVRDEVMAPFRHFLESPPSKEGELYFATTILSCKLEGLPSDFFFGCHTKWNIYTSHLEGHEPTVVERE